jgi:hypothetical protein
MDVLQLQVRRARRRLVLEQFISIATWSLFVTLLVAVVGVAIPKIWVLAIDSQTWMWSWVGGSIGAGVLTAIIWTFCVRRSSLEAAIEIDRRFGLKERVSSTLALGPEERETDIGKALVTDTARRVERIDVKDKFRLSPNWRNLLPLLPAAIVALLAILPNAVMKKSEASTEVTQAQQAAMKKKLAIITQQLLKNQDEKKGDDTNLKEGEFKQELAKKLNNLANKENAERKDTMIKLNDLAHEIEKKKKEFGGAEELKKELGKLKEIEKGPADKFAEALKDGDLGKAQEELKKLVEAAKKGELKEEDKKALAKQLEKIKEQIEQKKQQKEQVKKELEEEVKKKMAAGDQEGAEKAQQKLDEMKQKEQQAQQKMEKMAQKLGECAKCMKEGGKEGNENAGKKMEQLAKDLKDLEKELKEVENLDEMLDQLADAKEAMQGDAEDGKKGQQQDGEGEDGKDGKDGKEGDKPGKGKNNKGRGQGARDEEENKTSAYDSRVAAEVDKKGQSVKIGDAGGKNVKGKTSLEIREAIRIGKAKETDAQDETALPREQREHSKQYFERFRKGEVNTLTEEPAKEPAKEEPATK